MASGYRYSIVYRAVPGTTRGQIILITPKLFFKDRRVAVFVTSRCVGIERKLRLLWVPKFIAVFSRRNPRARLARTGSHNVLKPELMEWGHVTLPNLGIIIDLNAKYPNLFLVTRGNKPVKEPKIGQTSPLYGLQVRAWQQFTINSCNQCY